MARRKQHGMAGLTPQPANRATDMPRADDADAQLAATCLREDTQRPQRCEKRQCAASAEQRTARVEPISKSSEEDNEASELYEAEEVLGVVFPTDEDAALPLNPSKEALHEPASHIAAQPSPILRGRLASVAAMRRDHLDAVLAQLLIEWIAIVGAIANQILRLGLDHVEVEA